MSSSAEEADKLQEKKEDKEEMTVDVSSGINSNPVEDPQHGKDNKKLGQEESKFESKNSEEQDRDQQAKKIEQERAEQVKKIEQDHAELAKEFERDRLMYAKKLEQDRVEDTDGLERDQVEHTEELKQGHVEKLEKVRQEDRVEPAEKLDQVGAIDQKEEDAATGIDVAATEKRHDSVQEGNAKKAELLREEEELREADEKLKALSVEDVEADEDEDLGEAIPSGDYERFLSEYSSAHLARHAILHTVNARISELEHKANCWKLLRVARGEDLKKLYAVLMGEKGADALQQFENKAFLEPYTEGTLKEHTGNYAQFSEQFFPQITLKNFFPELGPVTGDIPRSLSGSAKSTILNHQPPLLVDPSCYECTMEKVVVKKGKKEKTVNQEIPPQPLFSGEQLINCLPIKQWAQNYNGKYLDPPTMNLILRELSPDTYPDYKPTLRPVVFGMISGEYKEAVKEYTLMLESNQTNILMANRLAANYIEKRMVEIDVSLEPEKMKVYASMKENMEREKVIALNAIYRYSKDKEKFARLEDAFFLSFYYK